MCKPPEVSGGAFLNVPFEILIKQRDVKHVQGTAVHEEFFQEPARAVKLVGRVVVESSIISTPRVSSTYAPV